MRQNEYLKDFDKIIDKLPSKSSVIMEIRDDELKKQKLEKIKDTSTDLTLQMKLKTYMENTEAQC